MNKIISRLTAFTLVLAFAFSSMAFTKNTDSFSYAAMDNALNLNLKETVKGNPVKIVDFKGGYIKDDSFLIYEDEEGKEEKFASILNDDNGIYYFDIQLEDAGNWKVKEYKLSGIDNVDNLEISVFDNLESMTGETDGYMDLSNIENSISGEEFENMLTGVKGFDSQGKYSEVTVNIDGKELFIDYDGISSSLRFIDEINLSEGNYNMEFRVDNKSISKNISLTSEYSNVVDNIQNKSKLNSIEGSSALSSVNIRRYSGANRYTTAVEISKSKFKNSDNVVLVNGSSENEILSAASLAGQLNAPILLTTANSLDNNTKAEIDRLNAEGIYIIGNSNNISRSIENNFRKDGKIVSRLTGNDIYGTAITVAKASDNMKSSDTVILSSASSVVDSLSAAALSASKKYPILYTDKDTVPASTLKYISTSQYKNVIVVGGPSTITNNVVKSLEGKKLSVTRVSGSNRFTTSTTLANKYFGKAETVNIASGMAYVDALSGAAVAGLNNSPVVLATGDNVTSELNSYFSSNGTENINIFGGKSSISAKLESSLASALNSNNNPPASNEPTNPGSNIHADGSKARVLLDPGHGAGAKHNRGYVGPRWKNEGDGNYYFSLMVKKELEAYGIQVGTTRSNINEDPDLYPRGYAGEGYDLFISLHTNAANGSAQGVEIYEDVDRGATTLINNLTNTISTTLGNPNRGLKRAYYGENKNEVDPKANYYAVLRANKAKAGMLIEHCFHDTPADVAKYEAKAEVLAKNMARDIAQYFGLI